MGFIVTDKIVDQLNNEIGRQIAKEHPHATNKDLANLVLQYYKNKGLFQAEKDSHNYYTVVQKTIPLELFIKSQNILETLDNTGAGPTMRQERQEFRRLQEDLMNSEYGYMGY